MLDQSVSLENVVIVTDSLSVDGGSAKVALGSAIGLAESGLNVTVFAASGRPSAALERCKNIRLVSTDQGDFLTSKNRLAAAWRGLWNRTARARMKEVLAGLDPSRTVVHVHGWTKALSPSVVASAVRADFPVVLTLHEYFTACPNGCLYLHREQRVCTLRPMSLACVLKDCDSRSYAFKLYRVARQWIQRRLGAIPTMITDYITVSDFSRRILEPLLPSGRQFHSVENPVDAERAARVVAESKAAFVFIGRLSAEKGGALFAEAAKRAVVRAVFVGDGPERGAIERINPRAVVTGWLDSAGVRAQLQDARCIVVPSLWYETNGLVVREAAALGIPAIVPTDTAPGELVDSGVTGLCFHRGDVDNLAEQLRACADDALVAHMSRSTYDRFWRQPSTMRAHVSRLSEAYRGMLLRLPCRVRPQS